MQELAERAAQMRRDGLGVKRIARELGVSHHRVMVWLRDVPLPASVARPRARDGVREAALLLRDQGRTYAEIRDELGVSKGTLSLWLRGTARPSDCQRATIASQDACVPMRHVATSDQDIARALRSEGWLLREIAAELSVALKTVHVWTRDLPIPAAAVHGRTADEVRAMSRAYWDAKLGEREVERQAVTLAASAAVGRLSSRDVELLAVAAYWCEGAKSKPWRRTEFLSFINSDPDLIRLFVQWLRSQGVPDANLSLTLSIHESADVPRATSFWSEVVGIGTEHFSKPSIKRHNPKTVRKNTGADYNGCLVVGVRQSRLLYQRMEGIWRGIVAGVAANELPG